MARKVRAGRGQKSKAARKANPRIGLKRALKNIARKTKARAVLKRALKKAAKRVLSKARLGHRKTARKKTAHRHHRHAVRDGRPPPAPPVDDEE